MITTSQDEDFGMNAVEAMASGKPVIAPDEGGYRETVVHGQTGILIDAIDENKLRNAILKLGEELAHDPAKYREACQISARRFGTGVFIEKIKSEISLSLNATGPGRSSHAKE